MHHSIGNAHKPSSSLQRIEIQVTSPLHRKIVSHLLFCQFAERRFYPTCALDLACRQIRLTWDCDHTDFDRLLCHVALKPFLKREQCRVDGIFQTDVVVVPGRGEAKGTLITN